MTIEEIDIFSYVFFPESLSKEVKTTIASDPLLKEAIEFYSQLRLNSEKKVTEKLKRKLAAKISAYTYSEIIELYPLINPIKKEVNGNKMAAGTKELAPKISTKTFVDSDKDYLIKVMNYETETKIFVFSTKGELVKNFDLIIEPQKITYHLEDNSEPLVISHSVNAQKIQLKFN